MNKGTRLIMAAAILAATVCSCSVTRGTVSDGWTLVWEDNFDQKHSFDTATWSRIDRGTSDWNRHMSHHDACYDMRKGNLVLRGILNDVAPNDTAPFITGGICSMGKRTFSDGRLEIRARLNAAQGAWPAIWLLPENGSWPRDGEIDIMERLNGDSIAYQTVHSHYTYNLGIKDNPPSHATGPIDPDAYNVYAVEMYPDSLAFFINGRHTFTYRRIPTDKEGQFPFNRPFYLLIDMQLGGSWVGAVRRSDLPVEMLVDYVRFYKRRQRARGHGRLHTKTQHRKGSAAQRRRTILKPITQMKKQIITALAALLILPATAQEWKPLFNGKNLSGWTQKNGKAEYKVEDGAIVGYTKMNTPNSFLCTKKNYDNFILEFQFKISDGLNSGVQLRSESLKSYQDGRVHGYQFEIDPSQRAWTGGIYDEARRGWLYPLTKNPRAKKAFKNGQWNKARIEAYGNSIRTWVNDIPCANLWDNKTLSGLIALQVHAIQNKSDEGKTIAWRDIRICTEDVEKYLTPEDRTPQVNCIDNTLSPQEEKMGWKLLWDGKTTNGWRGAKLDAFPDKGWKIEDGVLKVLAADGGESTNGGDIVTTETYDNFILTVDFKITKGANSGIKYFVDPEANKGEGSAIGCEFQILDDERHPDAKLGVKGNRKLGSLYDLIPAPEKKPFDINNFNTAMIIVRGKHVEHWLNGVKLLEYERDNQMWNALVAYSKYKNWKNFGNHKRGNILLQDHGNEVWFKNVKIKPIKMKQIDKRRRR